ncbi:MAG TPA: response regulator [Rhizomicrobium sp.]
MTTLLVDSDHFTRGLIAQMLRGFGMDAPAIYDSGRAAKAHLLHHYSDLCIFEAAFPDMESAELIRWIRRQDKSPLRFVPIIVLSSYTQHRHVTLARDAGANLVLTKPVSPQVLFDHIAWVAKAPRPFIEAGAYAGPDRRFRTMDPPDGQRKRESDFTEVDDSVAQAEETPSATPVSKKAKSQ